MIILITDDLSFFGGLWQEVFTAENVALATMIVLSLFAFVGIILLVRKIIIYFKQKKENNNKKECDSIVD